VVTKRRIVEATIACIEKLDVAEEIVMNVHQQEQLPASASEAFPQGGTGSGLRRRALLK
jgi:predicted regulator of amino acid metabolism with ACT domain